MRFTDGRRWWLYTGSPTYALGTSLAYLRSWWSENPFRDMQTGEDKAFGKRAEIRREIIVADAGDLMYATVHQGNTSPRQLRGKAWKELALA